MSLGFPSARSARRCGSSTRITRTRTARPSARTWPARPRRTTTCRSSTPTSSTSATRRSGEVDSRLEVVEDWQEPNRKGVITYVEDGKPRGVLLWNVWDKLDDARELIRGPEREPLPSSALARSRKPRRGTELVCEKVFRPLAHPLVLLFARLRVPPPLVVVAAGGGRPRGRGRARARLVARRRAPRPAEDAARQRGRPARASHRPDERLRPVPGLRGRPARERGALRRARLDDRAAGARTRRLRRAHERAQPQLQRRAAVACRFRRARGGGTRDGASAPGLRPRLRAAGPACGVSRRAAACADEPGCAVSLLANLGMSTQLAVFGL